MNERGGYEDLYDLGHRSVIPYRELSYIAQACPDPAYLSAFVKWRLSESFIAQGQEVTLRPGARQVALRWLKSHTTSRVLMVRSSK
jgi:hypothetical protein